MKRIKDSGVTTSLVVTIGLFVGMASGCDKKPDTTVEQTILPATIEPSAGNAGTVEVIATKSDLPACDASRENRLYYVAAEKQMYVCIGGAFATSDSPATDDVVSGGTETKNPCGTAAPGKIPDVVAVAGQVKVSLPEGVDPCLTEGYVVGLKTELPLQVSGDNSAFFNNLPPGTVDIIMTTGGGAALSTPEKRGIRLNGVLSLPGVRRDLKDFEMPVTGALSGTAKLSGPGVADHAGIQVYIPGTGYSALTDADGNFSIDDVPQGVHNLYFERDGYYRGQAEQLEVVSDETTDVDTITLILSTGEGGTFEIGNGKLIGDTYLVKDWDLQLNIAPTPRAVLMMIADNAGFDGATWEPVFTSRTLAWGAAQELALWQQSCSSCMTFDMPRPTRVYMKFSDANGLESGVISKKVSRDIFSDGTTPFTFTITGTRTGTTDRKFAVTGITIPATATAMKVSSPRHNSFWCSDPLCAEPWQTPATSTTYELRDSYADCGVHNIRVTFQDVSGFAHSSTLNYATYPNGPGNPVAAVNACDTPIPGTDAPTGFVPNDVSAKNRYNVTNAGSKLAVIGYASDGTFTGGVFDPDTSAWTAVLPTGAPAGRSDFGLTASADYIVVYGGTSLVGSVQLTDINVYKISTGIWSTTPALNAPAARYVGTAAVKIINDTLVIWGGVSSPLGSPLADGGRYDLAAGTWNAAGIGAPPVLMSARSSMINMTIGTKLLITGGYSGDVRSALYDPASDAWQAISDAPSVMTIGYSVWTQDGDRACAFQQVNADKALMCYDESDAAWTQTLVATTQFSPTLLHAFAVKNTTGYYVSDGSIYTISLTTGVVKDNDFDNDSSGSSPVFSMGQFFTQYSPAISHYLPGKGLALWSGTTNNGSPITKLGALVELR